MKGRFGEKLNSEVNQNQGINKVARLIVVGFITIVFLTTGCSAQKTEQIKPTATTDPYDSGNVLLVYADQYREVSEIMIRKFLDQDISGLKNQVVEAGKIYDTVEQLTVSSRYSKAKELLSYWILYDAYQYVLVVENESKDKILTTGQKGLDYSTYFIEEMGRLGHEMR